MKNITVKVTQEDIDRGGRHCFNCPIAEATWRALRGQYDVIVISEFICISGEGGFNLKIPLSRQLKKFIRDFDRGRRVRPLLFVLREDRCN